MYYYLNLQENDIIEVSPTYRLQMDPFLRSNIKYANSYVDDYKPEEPYQATVVSETKTGIWILKNGLKEFLEKDSYLFKKL